ncbi:MAG: HNH endonuclease [Janthinobacterium lividum]
MNFYVGLTDTRWFDFLRQEPREDVNFWKPLGGTNFGAVPSGAPFLLKLRKPAHCVAGVGFFTNQLTLPLATAWDMFGPRNGFADCPAFYQAIQGYRKAAKKEYTPSPEINCLVLTAPIFFRKPDWIPAPADWGDPIVTGKVYSTAAPIGAKLWADVSATLLRYQQTSFTQELAAADSLVLESPGIYREALTKVRIGQGAFKALVTQAYEKKCAISGEKTLPVLEAAHIQPFSQAGPNSLGNGLLLRSDLHKLFDRHYLTIDADDRTVHVSSRIREEFQNGKEYYRFDKQPLKVLPKNLLDQPARQYLQHHNNLFMP